MRGIEDENAVGISVVVRTKDSARTIGTVLERLGPGGHDEIIIVDSGSKDGTLEIAAKNGAKIILAEGVFDYSRSLNLGFDAANNPWVLVLSSHCIPVFPGYLDRLRSAISTFPEPIAVAYGSLELTLQKALAVSREPVCFRTRAEWEQSKKSMGGNGNALYRRNLWERHGFNGSLRIPEDLEWFLWALSSGFTVGRVPAAAVLYRNQGSLRHMFAKGFHDSRAAREVLGSGAVPFSEFCVGIVSLVKNLLLMRFSIGTFLRQSAHLYGVFRSSRRSG